MTYATASNAPTAKHQRPRVRKPRNPVFDDSNFGRHERRVRVIAPAFEDLGVDDMGIGFLDAFADLEDLV